MNEFVVLNCGHRRFAVGSTDVVERCQPAEMVLVPRAPTWLSGAAYVGGRVLAVVDLDALLGGIAAPRHEWLVVRMPTGPVVLSADSIAFGRGDTEPSDAQLSHAVAKIGADRFAVLSLEELSEKIRLKNP